MQINKFAVQAVDSYEDIKQEVGVDCARNLAKIIPISHSNDENHCSE